MTELQLLAVLIGIGAGYWAISWLLSRKSRNSGGAALASQLLRFRNRLSLPFSKAAGAAAGSPLAETWFTVLGVDPGASRTEIEHAYQSKISQYGSWIASAPSGTDRAFAEKQKRELDAAFDFAKKLRP
jgi:hypothetical protein